VRDPFRPRFHVEPSPAIPPAIPLSLLLHYSQAFFEYVVPFFCLWDDILALNFARLNCFFSLRSRGRDLGPYCQRVNVNTMDDKNDDIT